jgi:SAM-dependent methyltransferase
MLTNENKKLSYSIALKLKIVREFNFDLNAESVLMDFGCGDAKSVQELRDLGYQAFGCDMMVKSEGNVSFESMMKEGIIRKIDLNPYTLPFKDNSFDFIFSNSVFEHIKNYSETISELSRVLKPNGLCLHTFASRYNPIESHVFVPFSSIIQSYWWLYFWVLLGVRNEWQDCHSVKERTKRYYNYLKDKTNYLSKSNLQKHFEEHFNEVIFCEKEFLKFSRRGKFINRLSKTLAFIPSLYGTFRSRVVLTRLPDKTINDRPKVPGTPKKAEEGQYCCLEA